MRKVFTPTTRKVYANQATPQITGTPQSTIRRVVQNNSNLISPSSNNNNTESPRILKQTTITRQIGASATTTAGAATTGQQMKCYVCDVFVGGQGSLLLETSTNTSHTKLPNKIGRVIGESFLVIVRSDDIVCKRCVQLFNQYDQMETQLDSIRNQLLGYISKKYAIDGIIPEQNADGATRGPASKLQKLNSGQATESASAAPQPNSVVRKVMAQTIPASPGSRKPPVKIYKCMSCDFTTGDLKQFTPHYEQCPGLAAEEQKGKVAPSPPSNLNNSTGTAAATVASPQAASTVSPSTAAGKVLARRPVTQSLQKSAETAANGTLSCNLCVFKTANKAQYDEHMRRHQVKVKPFKCRICNARFEDRETASKHARAHSTEYFKCGTCSVAYRDRNQLIKHFEVHRNDGTGGQQIIIKASSASGKAAPAAKPAAVNVASTQRLLQETIDEACNDAAAAEAVDAKNIHFFSCSICSLTFIQENYYTAHMETHKTPSAGTGAAQKKQGGQATMGANAGGVKAGKKATNGQAVAKGGESDDLESMFEKMHSDKSGGGQQGNDTSASGIDMPALDQGEEDATQSAAGGSVSMPSLDDDAEAGGAAGEGAEAAQEENAAANTSAEGGVPMEIEDMQTSVEGGDQLKFIVNENGQLLQLDNHILTDAEGNQIIVQGADSEHLQQLLQSVAGLEGGTIQMIQGENNQMILVQQDGNEPQLIDASLLNADGQIVIQQGAGAEGELSQDGVSAEEQQQQAQYDASDVAVLAAAAEQHEMLQAAAESAAVDESSQEDLGEGAQEVATEETSQQPEQSDDNSQAASEQAVSEQVASEQATNEQAASEETGFAQEEATGGEQEEKQQPQEQREEEEEEEEGGKGAAQEDQEQENVSSTTVSADEKVDSHTDAETEAAPVPAAEGQKEDFEFF